LSSNTNIGNTPVNQGYVQLIHTGETGGIDGTLRTLYDGDGTASDLQIASNKVKISTELYIGSKTITEYVQDVVGDMFDTNGSHTNITATYDDDGDGAIDLVATGAISGITGGTGIDATGSGNITIAIDSTVATLTGTQTLSNKTLASPTFTGDIDFTDASSPILTITDTTNTAQLRLFATDTTTDIGSLSAHKVNFRYNNDVRLQLEDSRFLVNAGSDDMDFIIKDTSAQSLIHSDAALSRVGILDGSPSYTLDVNGTGRFTGAVQLDDNLTVTGDLQVNGTTTTVNQTNLDVSDNIIGLNRGLTGASANDSGLIIERGTTGDNVFIGYDESLGTSGRVRFATTTALPNATGALSFSGDANVHAGRFYGDVTGNVTGDVTGDVTGSASLNLLKSSNLSDLASASTARTNLGVAIGSDVQAYNSTLASVAGGTYTGDDSITTLGTIGTGVWQGTAIASAYLDADTAHLSGTQTFSGAKTFSSTITGSITGNAGTATALATARSITMSGEVSSGSVNFDGTAGVVIPNTTIGAGVIEDGNIASDAAITITKLASSTISGVSLGGTLGALSLSSPLSFTSGTSYTGAVARTIQIDSTLINHDTLANYVANEHIDWTAASAGTIHSSNYTDTSQATTFVIQDGDTTNVTISQGKYVKFQALNNGGLDIDWASSLGAGSSGDPYDLQFKIDLSNMGALVDTLESGDNLLVYNADEGTALAPVSEIQSALNIPSASGTTDGVVTLNANGSLTGEYNLTFTGSALSVTGTASVTSSITTGYGVAFTNGNTNFLQYNNSGEDVLYLRDTTNGAMLLTYGTGRTTIHKNTRHSDQVEFEDTNAVINRVSGDLEIRTYGGYDINLMPAGNVGIGVASPAFSYGSLGLEIQSAGDTSLRLERDGSTAFEISARTSDILLYNVGTARPMRFGIAGTERFRIGANEVVVNEVGESKDFRVEGDTDQNLLFVDGSADSVGIGTSTPSEKIDIRDGELVFTHSSLNQASSGTIRFNEYNGDNVAGAYMRYNGSSNSFHMYLNNESTDYEFLRATRNSHLVLQSGGNNVGIGGTPVNFTNYVNLDVKTNASGGGVIGFHDSGGTRVGCISHTESINTFAVEAFNSHPMTFLTNNSEAMRIDASQRVGIGVASPAYKLDVRGSDIYTDGYIRADDGVITWSSTDGSVVTLTNNGTYTMLNNPQGNVGIYIGDTGDGQNYYQNGAHRFRSYDGSTYFGTLNSTGLKLGSGYASYKLDVAGDAKISSGSLGVGVNPNATDGRGDFSNDVVAYSTSDKRLKENIKPLENSLDKVMKISGVEFDWKELTEEEKKTIHGNEGHDVGVIAQEIEKVLPEVVTTRDSGYKAVKYEKIVPLLIEAIKEQQEQINKLERKLNG